MYICVLYMYLNVFSQNYETWLLADLKRHYNLNNAIFVKVSLIRRTKHAFILNKHVAYFLMKFDYLPS